MSKVFKIGCLVIALLLFIGMTFVAGFGVGALVGSGEEIASPKLHKRIIWGSGDNQIGVVSLDGVIVSSPTSSPLAFPSGIITPRDVSETVRLVAQDQDIKAVVVRINSPGGSAVASDEIYQYIKNLSAQKPVVISLGDTAASGGYYIATAGTFIMSNPATTTGSIGVIAEITDVQKLFEKIGLKQETYKAGEFKDVFSATRGRTPEEKAMIQELLDTTYDQFLSRVAAGRKLDIEKVRELAEGKIYSGQKAKELGLVDALEYRWDDAFEKAKELAGIHEATVVSISTKSRLDQFFGEVRVSNPLSVLLPFLLTGSGVQYLYK